MKVELRLGELPEPDALYLAHIHPGTCAEGYEEEGAHHGEGHEHAAHGEHAEQGENGTAAAEEIEWPPFPVRSDARGHGSSTTALDNVSMEKIFTGEPNNLNVHAAGSGNPPVLACVDVY